MVNVERISVRVALSIMAKWIDHVDNSSSHRDKVDKVVMQEMCKYWNPEAEVY